MIVINTLTIPVVTYIFNIIDWTLDEIEKIDTDHRNRKKWYLKITAVPVIVRSLSRIKKETDKHIYKIPEIQTLWNFLSPKESIINVREKRHPKETTKR